jgi:hypothetical protein
VNTNVREDSANKEGLVKDGWHVNDYQDQSGIVGFEAKMFFLMR